MKLSLRDDSKETFFYKEISKKRTDWLNEFGGIKIYRDNFLYVRMECQEQIHLIGWD